MVGAVRYIVKLNPILSDLRISFLKHRKDILLCMSKIIPFEFDSSGISYLELEQMKASTQPTKQIPLLIKQ